MLDNELKSVHKDLDELLDHILNEKHSNEEILSKIGDLESNPTLHLIFNKLKSNTLMLSSLTTITGRLIECVERIRIQ